MNRKLWGVVLGWVLVFCIGAPVRADGMVWPQGTLGYPAVRYHRVQVTIEDGHAVTRVEQEFYNPYDHPVSGRYLFPIPPEAALTRFKATVDQQDQAPVRQNREETNAALYEIVAQQHDPSLLQYVDWETLAFDLELPAGASRTMTLEYEQVLVPSNGLTRYRYVLGTERYSSLPLEEVSIQVQLKSSAGLATLYSASHAATVERLGDGRAEVRWSAQNVQPTEDFELFFSPAQDGFGGGLLTGRRQGQDHFLFAFAPELAEAARTAIPKDLVLVVDRSGSMSGEKLAQAQNALHFILGQLGEGDRFSIVGFDDQLQILSETLLPVDSDSRRQAGRFVDGLYANASTDLDLALRTGLGILARSEARPGAVRMVVFLTDGLPTAGVVNETQIADQAQETNARIEARLHVFGVGYDVNSFLLDRLAAENGGSVTYVQPGENLELVLKGFYEKIATPVLTDLEISFEGMEVSNLSPQSLPDLFQGSSLLLTGQYRATETRAVVHVRGRVAGQVQEYEYPFDLTKVGSYDFVARLWATRRGGELMDRIRVEGESPALVEALRGLGLGYGIVTPYTTFVVEAQADGAASTSNMRLYGNQAELNRSSGQTTIQARVQNQSYQQAAQASLAVGANVVNNGGRSLAQIGAQTVDLTLLQDYREELGQISEAWLNENVAADRRITFGSPEYFKLAADPEARSYLQSGSNVLFPYQGKVIAVLDPAAPMPPVATPPAPRLSWLESLWVWLSGWFSGR